MEIHSPERMKKDVCELSDYPPRIYLNLTSVSRSSTEAELKITGSKNEQSFFIANESKAFYNK